MTRRWFLRFVQAILAIITFGLYKPAEAAEPAYLKRFTTWEELLLDIKAMVQREGVEILSNDDPIARRIGYVAYDSQGQLRGAWEISLTDTKTVHDLKGELLYVLGGPEALKTAAGRAEGTRRMSTYWR